MKRNNNSKKNMRISQAERVWGILNNLRNSKHIQVSELAQEFHVSEVTIRNDIERLKDVVQLERYHGGASLVEPQRPYSGTYYGYKLDHCAEEKRLLASYAVRYLIPDGAHLLLDSGTQIEAFVKELKRQQRIGIRAVGNGATYGIHFLNYHSADYVQLGGVLNTRGAFFLDGSEHFSTNRLFGENTDKFLKEYCHGNYKAIVSPTGFTYANGLSVNTQVVIDYKRKIINSASEIIILIVHSKFFVDARQSVTHCGLSPDSWLSESQKPATIILDTRWEESGESEEFVKFASHPNIHEIHFEDRIEDYPDIRIFQTHLYNSPTEEK